MSGFEGQIALVTGASRGIGAATAKALAARGAHVILSARDDRALQAVEEEIFDKGGSATIAPVDLAEGEGIARLSAAIAGRWKMLDMLVINAAALPALGPVSMIDQREFNKVLTLNVLSTQALLAGFDALLRKSAAGRVVGLTTSVTTQPRAYFGAYAASKAAFEALLDAYALETKNLSPVRVAIVDPGATRTRMRERVYPGENPASVKPPEVVAEALASLLADDAWATGFRLRVPEPA